MSSLDDMQPTPDCCDIWAKIMPSFGWHTLESRPELALMPYIQGNGDIRYRVQFCPSCGKYRRDVEVLADRLKVYR